MSDEAVLDAPVESTTPETSAAEVESSTEQSAADTSSEQTQDAPEEKGSETTEGVKPETTKTETTKETGPALPKSLAATLKAVSEDPNNPDGKSAAKTLKDSYFSDQAYKKTFASVNEAREAKTLLSEIAGGSTDLQTIRETWQSTKDTLANIEETDQLLYQGSPDIVANVVSDLKDEGHLDALPKLTRHFLDALKQEDPEGFTNLHRGFLVDGLYEIGFPAGINVLSAALKNGDIDQAKSVVRSIVKWFSDEQNADRDHRALTKAETQKTDAEKKSTEDKYLALSKETAKPIDSVTNVGLGKELMAFLKTPFGKSLTRPELEDLARSIKGDFHGLLEKDKTYKSTVEKFLRAGKRSEAIEFHRSVVSKHAKGIVDKITNTRYPSKLRGTSVVKKAAAPTKVKTTASSGAYTYVSERPSREAMDPVKTTQMDLVLGRATLKNGNKVTWRENYRVKTT